MGRRRDGGADGAGMRRLGVARRARSSPPARSRPTSSERSRPGTSARAIRSATSRSSPATRENYRLEPALARRGDLPGVEVRRGRALGLRRGRADAAPAGDRAGDRRPHGRQRLARGRPARSRAQHPLRRRGTCATCSTSTTTRRSPSPRTTRARRTSTAGARRESGSRFAETRALRRAGREAEGDLPRAYPDELGLS